ncbi:Telomere repeat-binding factor 2 [Camellia lanceoleosa]|nr:Telomere repeat-binding factor 2 [Camellia lanceoleosa]
MKPSFPNVRRKKQPWTAEEEKMLKEGVQKFSTLVNKNLPWRKILEFGCHVFYGTRTPVDLKDKWRNILVKECSTK